MGMDENLQRDIIETSIAQNERKVPQVTGLNRSLATSLLDQMNIDYKFEGTGNLITAQNINAGDTVKRGVEIKLTLGVAADVNDTGLRDVPDLNGLSMRQALARITESGFGVNIVGSGTVFAQFPRAGEKLRAGSEITIRGRARSMNETTNVTARLP